MSARKKRRVAKSPAARGTTAQQAPAPRGPAPDVDRGTWSLRLARNVLLWILPAALVWVLFTGFYNRFLQVSAENLLNLFERPDVTQILPEDRHYAAILRDDFPPASRLTRRVRVTDIHFNLILMVALFMATPGVRWKQRLGDFGWAFLITVFFHIFLLFLWVKFTYATQLGSWSAENYGAFGQNFWGMSKHLLDLPVKLAWPLVMWAGFYLRYLLPAREA